MGTDYKVKFRTYDDVAQTADNARERLGLTNVFTFNIVRLIRQLIGKSFGGLGQLGLDLYENRREFAFVTFNPLVLHVDKEVWAEAEDGEPKARFILAHELGHIVMHGYYRLEFSEDEKSGLTFVQPEERSETQAHWFAASFLAPDRHALDCKSEFEICQKFDYPMGYIYLKREAVARKKVKLPNEICRNCGGFTMSGEWLNRKCRDCGAS